MFLAKIPNYYYIKAIGLSELTDKILNELKGLKRTSSYTKN